MPKAKLDSTFCLTAACQPGKKKTDYWDTITSGFVLEVRSSGGRTYYLRYFDQNGRQRAQRIGGFHDITFDQARKKAKQLRSQVVLGGDPAAEKERKRAVPTYATLAEQHLAYARTHQRSFDTTEMYMRRHILPRWGKLHLGEIKQQEIAKWLAEKADEGLAPATVLKIRVIFGRSFELGSRWSVAGCENNPIKGIPYLKFSNARERFLTASEAQRLFDALDGSGNPQLKNIVRLLLLTGARKTELMTAQWKHIDLERRAWHIPTSKTGKPRYVPLAQPAIDIIAALPRWDDCPWLLPNPVTRRPYTDIKRPWDTVRTAAGLDGLRIHDLRHSAASFMINAGIDLFAVGRILGHADHQSTMRYSHLANDTLMAAVEAGAAKMKAGWASTTGN